MQQTASRPGLLRVLGHRTLPLERLLERSMRMRNLVTESRTTLCMLHIFTIDVSRLITSLSVQKVPQTSVAPTYKLTLPSEFEEAKLSHLVDQAFDMTDQDGTNASVQSDSINMSETLDLLLYVPRSVRKVLSRRWSLIQ